MVKKIYKMMFEGNLSLWYCLVLLITMKEWIASIVLAAWLGCEVTHKNYIEYLESDRDNWFKKFMKEKYNID